MCHCSSHIEAVQILVCDDDRFVKVFFPFPGADAVVVIVAMSPDEVRLSRMLHSPPGSPRVLPRLDETGGRGGGGGVDSYMKSSWILVVSLRVKVSGSGTSQGAANQTVTFQC